MITQFWRFFSLLDSKMRSWSLFIIFVGFLCFLLCCLESGFSLLDVIVPLLITGILLFALFMENSPAFIRTWEKTKPHGKEAY